MHKILKSLLVVQILFSFCTPVLAEENTVVSYAQEEKPEITSEYVYMFDLDTNQVMWDKGSTETIYPASLTKMMTLIVAIENLPDVNETILITDEIMDGLVAAGASMAGFRQGDEPTIETLMYGVILPSGAECSRALGITVAGSMDQYVEMMNEKAQELGMVNTHYANTTGLHDDNHYSTLYDQSILLQYCLQNDLFYEIFTCEHYKAEPTKNYPDGLGMDSVVFKYINHPEASFSVDIEGFIGGKSGYTIEARYCLASIAERNGMRYALLTAHAWIERSIPSHIIDAGIIYNYYFDHYSKQTLLDEATPYTSIKTKYNLGTRSIDVYTDETISGDFPTNGNTHVEVDLPTELKAPIKKGDVIGSYKIYSWDQLVYEGSFIAGETVGRNILVYIGWSIYDAICSNVLVVFSLLGIVIILVILASRFVRIQKLKKRKLARKREKVYNK